MPDLAAHELECIKILGKPFTEVHKWLDEYFNILGPMYHRDIRHHATGILEAVRLFGVEGGKAAEIHILQDYGYIPTEREAKERKFFSQST